MYHRVISVYILDVSLIKVVKDAQHAQQKSTVYFGCVELSLGAVNI